MDSDEAEVVEFNVSDEEGSPDDRPLDEILNNNINANNNSNNNDEIMQIPHFSGNGTSTYTINVRISYIIFAL